jgi:hypothetical protein
MIPLHLATVSSSISPANLARALPRECDDGPWLPAVRHGGTIAKPVAPMHLARQSNFGGSFLATAWPATGFIEVVDRGSVKGDLGLDSSPLGVGRPRPVRMPRRDFGRLTFEFSRRLSFFLVCWPAINRPAVPLFALAQAGRTTDRQWFGLGTNVTS